MSSVWQEVGDGCFRRRYESFDLNIGVVRGNDGLLLIDTRCHDLEARELLEHLAELGTAPVRRIVNTHKHFDHYWGNATMRAEYPAAEIWAHERFVVGLDDEVRDAKEWLHEVRPQWDIDDLPIEPPDHFVHDEAVIDLGDRGVVLRHPGRGHTDNDIVALVPDADVLYAGDIVEESGPPSVGPDSFLDEWPATNRHLLQWITPDTVVVPGHGDIVDRAFVERQTEELATRL